MRLEPRSDVSSRTEAIASHLAAQREKSDPINEARRQIWADWNLVVEAKEKLRAILLERTPTERLTSDVEVVHGLISGLVGSRTASEVIERLPEIRHCLALDVEAAFEGDPAAKTYAEVIIAYPSIHAISTYRIGHELYHLGEPVVARIMGEHAHSNTGIDIHPGATIGCHFFIDHGTGVVIGETTIIGNRVKMYHGVTLGAFSNKSGRADANKKRHPTIEDDVTIYPNATILGGETTIGAGAVIGGNAWVTNSVPAYTRVVMEPRLQLSEESESDRPLAAWC